MSQLCFPTDTTWPYALCSFSKEKDMLKFSLAKLIFSFICLSWGLALKRKNWLSISTSRWIVFTETHQAPSSSLRIAECVLFLAQAVSQAFANGCTINIGLSSLKASGFVVISSW